MEIPILPDRIINRHFIIYSIKLNFLINNEIRASYYRELPSNSILTHDSTLPNFLPLNIVDIDSHLKFEEVGNINL